MVATIRAGMGYLPAGEWLCGEDPSQRIKLSINSHRIRLLPEGRNSITRTCFLQRSQCDRDEKSSSITQKEFEILKKVGLQEECNFPMN